MLNYVEQTGLTIYQQWSLNGKKENIDDVIKAAQKLMRGGVDKFLNK
ncbi:hypothetical protein [Lactobacillus kitasatonis]|nr:hypothetical protein [Lactobacillus kitasatonis]